MFRRFLLCGFLSAAVWAGAAAADPAEPPPGSALRAALLDSARGPAEAALGAPVEFVVIELLADGDRAFGRMRAQRPGGGVIRIEETPMVLVEGLSPDMIDGPRLVVFWHFDGTDWQIQTYDIGATDAWWFGYDCENYAAFFRPEAC